MSITLNDEQGLGVVEGWGIKGLEGGWGMVEERRVVKVPVPAFCYASEQNP